MPSALAVSILAASAFNALASFGAGRHLLDVGHLVAQPDLLGHAERPVVRLLEVEDHELGERRGAVVVVREVDRFLAPRELGAIYFLIW